MNIFVLDRVPSKAATFLHNVHLNKMQTELCQLISTLIWRMDCDFAETYYGKDSLYAPTHEKHPCSIWLTEALGNFLWAYDLLIGMDKEYQLRQGKQHGAFAKCFPAFKEWRFNHAYKAKFPKTFMTAFAQCMSDSFKREDAVEAYRAYYQGEKMFDKNGKSLMNWGTREIPYWLVKFEF